MVHSPRFKRAIAIEVIEGLSLTCQFQGFASADWEHSKTLTKTPESAPRIAGFRIQLGLNHEQQHQELILTDVKYNLGNNPLKPVYVDQKADDSLEFNAR